MSVGIQAVGSQAPRFEERRAGDLPISLAWLLARSGPIADAQNVRSVRKLPDAARGERSVLVEFFTGARKSSHPTRTEGLDDPAARPDAQALDWCWQQFRGAMAEPTVSRDLGDH
jgi:hypothetical protein